MEPYPEEMKLKGLLRRAVQIAKRHRDLEFIDDTDGLAPLSIIVTTLASRAYESCVGNFVYDQELDLIVDLLRRMPNSIETRVNGSRVEWYLWNQTTVGENFARNGTSIRSAPRPSSSGIRNWSPTSRSWLLREVSMKFAVCWAMSWDARRRTPHSTR